MNMQENKKTIIGLSIGGGVLVIAAIAVALYFFLGGKKDSYVNVIPKDSFVMARADLKSLVHDNNIDIDALLSKTKMDEKELGESGIDLSSPVYMFSSSKVAGFVAKVSDKDKAKAFIEDHHKDIGFSEDDMDKKNDYYYLASSSECICIDGDKILMTAFLNGEVSDEDDACKQTIKLMEQDKDKSVYDLPIYDEILAAGKSVTVNLEFKSMPEQATREIEKMEDVDAVKALMDSHMLFSFDIKDDAATLALDVKPQTDKAKSIFDKYADKQKKIKGDLCGYGPKNPLVWGIMGIDGSEYVSAIKDNQELVKAFAEIPSTFDWEGVIKSFSGDCAFGMAAPSGDDNIPEFMFCSQVKNDNAYSSIKKLCDEQENSQYIIKENDGELNFFENTSYNPFGGFSSAYDAYSDSGENYGDNSGYDEYAEYDSVMPDYDASEPVMEESQEPEVDPSQKPKFTIGNKKSLFYVTNGSSASLLKANDSNVEENKSEICECFVYFICNIQAVAKALKEVAQKTGNTEASTAAKYFDEFDTLIIKATSYSHVDCVLRTNDGKKISEIINDLLG